MTVINLSDFHKYSALFGAVCSRGTALYENLYLDFEKKEVYFFGQNKQAKIPLKFTGDIHKNIFVPLSFVSVVSRYESINLEDGVFTSVDSNEQITFEEIKIDADHIDTTVFDSDINCFDVDKVSAEKLVRATSFISQDYPEFSAAFVKDNNIFSSNKLETLIDSIPLSKDTLLNIDVLKVLKFGLGIKQEENIDSIIKISNTDRKLYLKFSEAVVVFTLTSVIKPLDFTNPTYISTYKHENMFYVKRYDLYETVSFLKPFAVNAPVQRIYITLSSEKSYVEVKDGSQAKKEFKLCETYSGPEITLVLSLTYFDTILKTFVGNKDNDVISFSFTKDFPKVSVQDKLNYPNMTLVFLRYRE